MLSAGRALVCTAGPSPAASAPPPEMAAPAGGSVRGTPNLEYKLLRKFKVFITSNVSQLSADNHNLVVSSPTHGVVFVASADGLLAVYRVAELLYSEADPSRVTVKLPVQPTLITVNNDGELLAVGGNEKSILIYNVKDFRDQDASPKLLVPCGSQRSEMLNMQWSPTMNETLAIGFRDKITILHVGTGTRDEIHSRIRWLSWRPSGSSLVVGHSDGPLRVYSPDLSLEKSIPEPALPLPGKQFRVGSVHWMSNNRLALVYYNNSDFLGRKSAYISIDALEGELPPRTEYVGRLETDLVYPRCNLLQIKPWNVMVCWPRKKAVIKLLPPDRGDLQAHVQLLSELLPEDGMYPVGVALDKSPVLRISSQSNLHEPTNETITLLHVLTQAGDLATYTVGERPSTPSVDTESSRTTSCSKPAALEPPSIYSNTSRASLNGGAPDELPPLGFHSVHGESISISSDGSVAKRVKFKFICGGVAFSDRPVRVNEKVCIRFVQISDRWRGVISVGFTTHNPTTLSRALPKTARDLTNKPGNWAKALGERFCEKDNILYYYVNSVGDVHYGVNGEDKGLFFSGVDTRSPLWALIDVYGNCINVQFADPRASSQIRRPNQSPVKEERVISGMRALSVDDPLPQLRYQSALIPLSLHRTKGRNVQFINDRGVAARIEAESCQGYVFTAHPMQPGRTIVVQILATAAHAGSLAIGLTSCDPASIRPCDLPDDAGQLLGRPEYWVVRRDAASGLGRGDELAVTLSPDGKVRISRNGSNPVTVMHVDHTVRLWAFVDINGATQKVRMLSSQTAQMPQQHRVLAGSAQNINTSGGTVLADSLPPQNGGQNANQQMTLASAHCTESNQLCSASQNSCNEHLQIPNDQNRDVPSTSRAHPYQPIYPEIGEGHLTDPECIICFENPINSVLSKCGHMCMCYNCAVQQWRGKGGGQCPLCRAQIKDVIRTYKS